MKGHPTIHQFLNRGLNQWIDREHSSLDFKYLTDSLIACSLIDVLGDINDEVQSLRKKANHVN